MTVLSKKTATGELSFNKYVRDNPDYKDIVFEIEKDLSSELFQFDGKHMAPGETFPSGTPFVIRNSILLTDDQYRFVEVELSSGQTGWFPISRIRKPTGINSGIYEDKVVEILNEFIFRQGKPVDFRVGGDVYSNITYALKVNKEIKDRAGLKSDPKADIILCKEREDPLGPGSIFLSHKKEGGARAFQQYGGISHIAGKFINRHEETQEFLGNVVKCMDTSGLSCPVLQKISCPVLQNSSIFGPEYSSGNYSLQHTQMIGQGLPEIKYEKQGVFNLDFNEHSSTSGKLDKFVGDYEPVFSATKRNGRGFEYNNIKYEGVRLGIFPMKVAMQRKDIKILS